MDKDNVTPIINRQTLGQIILDAESAPLLLELLTKAAAPGPQAHALADLYAQTVKAARALANEA